MSFKVLVADKFERSGIDGLKAAGCEVVYEPDLKDDALTQAIASSGADVLVVRGTKVTAPTPRRCWLSRFRTTRCKSCPTTAP